MRRRHRRRGYRLGNLRQRRSTGKLPLRRNPPKHQRRNPLLRSRTEMKLPLPSLQNRKPSGSIFRGAAKRVSESYHSWAAKAKALATPSAPGSKPVPDGAPNCLAGLTFVFTGELTAFAREEAQELVKRYGGCVISCKSSQYLTVTEVV